MIALAPVNPFDVRLARLIQASVSREDFYSDAVSIGLEITDLDTYLRFALGDLVSLVEGAYGSHKMADFAGHIKRARSTLYGYAAVSRFYPQAMRGAWLAEPALSWSHMRVAMRAGALEDALGLLDEAASNAWSVDYLAREMALRGGQTTAGQTVYRGPVRFRVEVDRVLVMGLKDIELEEGKDYECVIKEMR